MKGPVKYEDLLAPWPVKHGTANKRHFNVSMATTLVLPSDGDESTIPGDCCEENLDCYHQCLNPSWEDPASQNACRSQVRIIFVNKYIHFVDTSST